jgi:nicotinate-nucleotide--dimethylbenzimidazole phosphoribosyltransferase
LITGKEMEKLKIIPPDAQIYAQVKASWDKIAKPLDGLGQFETMFAQIGAITGSSSLSIEKKVILTMCADNGVVAEGVSQSGQEVTAVVAGFMGQQASSVGKMARRAGVDVIPVDIGINTKETLPGVRDCKVMQGTRDFLQEPAMTEEEALQALSVGIDLVRECKDKGYQLIGTGEMGIGNTTTSSMLVAALTGRTAEEVTGRGAGLNDAGLLRKQQVIAQALEKYEKEIRSAHALSMLAAFGGLDIAVSDDRDGDRLFDCPDHVPVGFSAVQLGLCSAVYCNGSSAGILHCLGKEDGVDAGFVPAQPEFYRNRNTAFPDSRPDDLLCQRNIPHQCAACAGGDNLVNRTAHVDVDPVRVVLLYQCGGFSHEFRFAAEQL